MKFSSYHLPLSLNICININNYILQRNDRLLTFQAIDQQELLLHAHPHQQVLPLLLHPPDHHQLSPSYRSPPQLPNYLPLPRNRSLSASRLRPVSLHSQRYLRCVSEGIVPFFKSRINMVDLSVFLIILCMVAIDFLVPELIHHPEEDISLALLILRYTVQLWRVIELSR